jgi:sodium/hydrogen antiporter
MEGMFSTEVFVATLALVGMVILLGALLSGFIERSGVPQVAVLLGLGAGLGTFGLGFLEVNLDSPILRTVATLSLVLVLFTDALTIDLRELRQHSTLALIVVGPGTLLSAALVGFAGWGLLGLAPAAAAIVGAALSSTDPVLLRGLLRQRGVPPAARQALRLESGLNDVVLLPVVLVAMAFLDPDAGRAPADWAKMAIDLFLLGPGAGVLIGLLAVATLDLVRRRVGIRRDYESLYALGVAFTAYAAAEALHGSGFLAVFAAGLTITALDVELCDCFLEYGETTAELALLFTFVLFGSSLIWSGLSILTLTTALFAVATLLIRPLAFLLSLVRTQLSTKERWLIAWFGPRGLSTLLIVLLPVFAGIPGSEALFPICCLVVLLSVVLHGGSPFILARLKERRATRELVPAAPLPPLGGGRRQEAGGNITPVNNAITIVPPDEDPDSGQNSNRSSRTLPVISLDPAPAVVPVPTQANGNDNDDYAEPGDRERISLNEVLNICNANAEVYLLDVRTERSFARDPRLAQGAVRMPPDHVVERATEMQIPKEAWIIAYCA